MIARVIYMLPDGSRVSAKIDVLCEGDLMQRAIAGMPDGAVLDEVEEHAKAA